MSTFRPQLAWADLADAFGISAATLTRRLRDGRRAREVIRAANQLQASPTQALLAAGMLEARDVQMVAGLLTVLHMSDRQLLAVLDARAQERQAARRRSGHSPLTA